ncbi:phosphate ABC transporter ATP-binding protein [Oscillibacter sp.]|uniref:phosphate ABC transporter ATP-binding protein n=3 Tax=unclassified Oscillibacter TaxID=2629304 RepID=UPI0028A0927B|nr:phosphate ABC transporter ATP-binding protein [Oscillibacter sp.]
METTLTLKDVTITYDKKPALEQVSLSFPKNRITAVIGPSGCGKTTLLRAMNRMLEEEPGAAVEGQILLNGDDVQKLPPEELRRRVGLVFQTPAPFPFSIYKNMTFALRYYGVQNKERLDAVVREKLTLAGLYEEVKDRLDKSALKLSGGQQQRLCIARALTAEPEVLLLDEPCSALDVKSIEAIEAMLLKLRETYTIILVTHNIAQARRIADYTAFFNNGRLVEFGEKDALFLQPRQEETKAFLSGIYG